MTSVAVQTALVVAAGCLASCGAVQQRSVTAQVERAATAGASTAPARATFALVAVALINPEAPLQMLSPDDGAERALWGPLRLTFDDGQPVVVGEAPRSAIIAATQTEASEPWLFVTEDGAAWSAPRFDGPLRRLESEAGARVAALSWDSHGAIALATEDKSVFFATSDGVARAPESLRGPVIAAAFSSADRGWIIEQPGRLFEVRDRGRTLVDRSLSGEAALEVWASPERSLVRAPSAWLVLGQDQRWRASAEPPRAERWRPITDSLANSIALSASLEPTRGRALALALGAAALSDGTLAMFDRARDGEVVFLRAESVRRVSAPCSAAVLHAFGDRVVLECGDEDSGLARFFIGSERGFEPLGSPREPLGSFLASNVHIARDGSAIVIEQGCAGTSKDSLTSRGSVLCVLDHGHSPRPVVVATTVGRVRAVRASRVLFDQGALLSGMSRDLQLADLSSLTPIAVEQSANWTHATLDAEGAVIATLPGRRSFVRAMQGRPVEQRSLPARDARVRSIDAERLLASAPPEYWLSEDQGRSWTPLALTVDGAASIRVDPRSVRARTASLLGAASEADSCASYACAVGDGLVLSERSWLRAPPIQGARRGAQSVDVSPVEPRRGPDQRVFFCGQLEALSRRTNTSARDERWGGAPGSRGWIAVDEREQRLRVRWVSLERERAVQRQSALSTLAPIEPAQSAPTVITTAQIDYRLRLATSAFAVVERCAGPDACEVLFAPSDGPVRSIATPALALSGARWRGELLLAESTDEQGFALWIARTERTALRVTLDTRAGADAVLAFDRRGNLVARRSFAWAVDACSMRALGFDRGELGIICARSDRPTLLQFYSLTGAERTLQADLSAPSACNTRESSPSWMVSTSAGWAPLFYVLGLSVPFELGVRARWSLDAAGPCLRELRVDPHENATGLQSNLRASLRIRPRGASFVAELIGRSSVERAPCDAR
jgi:hypothetical protein